MAGFFGSASVDWTDVIGSGTGQNNIVTLPFTTTITATLSSEVGSGALYYGKNGGGPTQYSAPFAVTAGDTLQWGAQSKGGYSAVVTVKRTGNIVIDTFNIGLTP